MRIQKKYETGTAATYISRAKAIKKLQLTLKDFGRLCILKGIYPHEPLHKKKANKGSTANKVFYYTKDIKFLAHEPIIEKFREYKIFLRKLTTAKHKRETDRVKRLYENRPEYQLDRIVRERYPTFESALRDLDDGLCLMFAYATLPYTSIIPVRMINECRRLTTEFMNYVIESKSLTKVFVSIKGIYYQAEINGEKITWIVPHDRGVGHVTEVDFKIMTTFCEFYIEMLGFVNFKLYQTIGLFYPPRLAHTTVDSAVSRDDPEYEEEQEKVYSLVSPLAKAENVDKVEEVEELDEFTEEGDTLVNRIQEARALRQLFSKYRFFLNREVPKDSLVFLIRSCGGTVSYENCPVKNFTVNDPKITHQVVDRPIDSTKVNISRSYVQPQFIYDSFNARKLLPVKHYVAGNPLPPHFSPFVNENAGDYIAAERMEMLTDLGVDVEKLTKPMEPIVKKRQRPEIQPGMTVQKGQSWRENRQKLLNEKGQELKLREMMIEKKHRRVYQKIKGGIKKKNREVATLKEKRKKLDAASA